MIQTLKPYTPWSFSFRRWVRRLRPSLPPTLPAPPSSTPPAPCPARIIPG
ncbi:MAG: hypothetical protein NC342_08585 [Pseudoflavonifractor sp.]|nr:hypothetical protein [Pseudoflavonifractor sp.]